MRWTPRRSIRLLAIFALLAGLAAGCGKKVASTGGEPSPPAPNAGPGEPASPVDGDSTPVTLPHPLFAGGDPRSAAARQTSQNNIKMMMLAMHSAHASNGSFPVGIYDKFGKLGLGWRVAILPYLEQENLYRQFKLDESWDSPHNKALIGQMPKVFAAPGGGGAEGQTYYRVFVGEKAVLQPPKPGQSGKLAPGGRLISITDGTSNTAMIAEAAEPVVWTRPDGLAFDPQKPLPKLGGIFGDGFHLGFADGSVRFFRKGQLDDKTLKAIISATGGEVVQLP